MPETGGGKLPSTIRIGDEVWVKPPQKWKKRHLTKLTSGDNVLVDGMPCHILNIYSVITPGSVCPLGGPKKHNDCKWKGNGVDDVLEVSQCNE